MQNLIANLSFRREVNMGLDSDVASDSSLIKDHPNRLPFTGTLLLLDQPSDQPPHGADNHPILVPKEIAQERLKSIIGMAVNYDPELESHAPRRKVGVITAAWIEGDEFKVRGLIWKKDFPEAEEMLQKNRGRLGMSMELGNVYVADTNASVWRLEKFHFTGATILKRNSAAYQSTDLAASRIRLAALAAAAAALGVQEEEDMAEKTVATPRDQGKLLTASIAAAVGPAITAAMKEGFQSFSQSLGTQLKEFSKEIRESNEGILAALAEGGEVDAESETVAADASAAADPSMAGAKKKNPSDPSADASQDDPSGATSDEDDPSALDSAADPSGGSADPSVPANRVMNKDADSNSKRWSKSGATTEIRSSRERTRTVQRRTNVKDIAAAAERIADLEAANEELASANGTLKANNAKLTNRVDKMSAQVQRMSDRLDRRSISPALANLLEKENVNVGELRASGTKMSPGQVDAMFMRIGVPLDVTTRIAMKNELQAAGIMSEGIINRNQN